MEGGKNFGWQRGNTWLAACGRARRRVSAGLETADAQRHTERISDDLRLKTVPEKVVPRGICGTGMEGA